MAPLGLDLLQDMWHGLALHVMVKTVQCAECCEPRAATVGTGEEDEQYRQPGPATDSYFLENLKQISYIEWKL
ncbi:hypothetical protein NFI96_001978 [Prochilodus magdalenae]|nr:hypothetical protein NFI96_001978 [Prochilodus magdalenae]